MKGARHEREAVDDCFLLPRAAQQMRHRQGVALPLFDEAALHLRHHAEHRHDDVPHLAARRHVRVEHRHEGVTLLALVDQVEHVTRVTPKAVEPSDDELVAGSKEGKHSSEFSSTITAAAPHLLGSDDRTASPTRSRHMTKP